MKRLPEKFEESISRQLGSGVSHFIASLAEAPPVSIRLHPLKNSGVQIRQPVPWTDFGKYLSSRPVFTLDPLFHAGGYYVQEASSMFLEQALKQTVALDQPLKVLDLCAAPGGKSTHILSLINRESLLVANEAIRSRASILSENIQKWGYPNCIVTNNDPADFRKLESFFNLIVVDAPCSGEGLFRKDPEAIDEWSPENVQLCAARQKRIISDIWDSLHENGIFIYCTCTYNTLENEENLKWLTQNQSVEFLRLDLQPEWGIQQVDDSGVIGYRFYPHRVTGEGFFLAVMRKLGRTGQIRLKSKKAISAPAKKTLERLGKWIQPRENTFFQFNDLIFYTPSTFSNEIELLLQNFKILYAGTNVATLKHEKLVPDHALALSVEARRENFPLVEVSEEDALKYLRRESIQLPDASLGFSLLTFQQLPIGWVNVLANRVNNMYPSDWRVRMSGVPH